VLGGGGGGGDGVGDNGGSGGSGGGNGNGGGDSAGHGDSQTYFFSPPKTLPRHFHHQKFVCNNANIYISVALKIINTPVNRSLSLN